MVVIMIVHTSQVVRACVEAGTNYVDVTGEPEFMLKCQQKYHDEAKEKGKQTFQTTSDQQCLPLSGLFLHDMI